MSERRHPTGVIGTREQRLEAALIDTLKLIVIDAERDGETIPIPADEWLPVWERAMAALGRREAPA